MQDFKEFKTYQLIKNNYFKDTLDWDIFLEQVVFEYSESIYSNESLKILFRDLSALERKFKYKSEQLFKEIVQDDFTYIQNLLNAIYRIYSKKLDSRLYRIYKNKEKREYFMYNLYYKDIELKNIDSLGVIQFFIDNFKLDFGNLGSAGLFINNQLKYCKFIRLERIEKEFEARLFEKSKYESTFEDRFVTNYKGYDIYEYQSTGRLRYTFWFSPIDSDYYSSIENIADCEFLIDRILEEK